jgi:hypothetical protein
MVPTLLSSKSGLKPNAIGAEHNEAIGRRMTHSQGSNSGRQALRVDSLAPTAMSEQIFRADHAHQLRQHRQFK